MKTKLCLSIAILVCSLFTFQACDEKNRDTDLVKPVINLFSPAEGDTLRIGDEHGIHFEAELSDNEMLASYKVDIHANFDGHGHSAAKVKALSPTVNFTFNKSWDISGQKNALIHHHEIKIPENATPGKYHLMVFCTDVSGNESYMARNIVLSHDGGGHEHE